MRQVSKHEAKNYADENGALFFETSAKSGAGIHELFVAIGEIISFFFVLFFVHFLFLYFVFFTFFRSLFPASPVFFPSLFLF